MTDTEVIDRHDHPALGTGRPLGHHRPRAPRPGPTTSTTEAGVHGRKIKVILKDDGYNPARAMANLTEMKGQIFAVNALLGTAIINATKDFFPENKIPLITAYADVRIWAKYPKDKLRYVFIGYPDYENEAEYLTTYAVKNLGAKKIGLFYQNDDYGKDGHGRGQAGAEEASGTSRAGRARPL